MGLFDGFPFTSKEERERRRRDFEKRVVPFGVEEQREKIREILKELFPGVDNTDAVFVYFNAKDAFTNKETKDEGEFAARQRLRNVKWIDGHGIAKILRLIELESQITSLDEFPTADDVLNGLYEEEEE
jgi:hypothetical protein